MLLLSQQVKVINKLNLQEIRWMDVYSVIIGILLIITSISRIYPDGFLIYINIVYAMLKIFIPIMFKLINNNNII